MRASHEKTRFCTRTRALRLGAARRLFPALFTSRPNRRASTTTAQRGRRTRKDRLASISFRSFRSR
eukprot:30497-Pelagococcus_subviridis.AAC.47